MAFLWKVVTVIISESVKWSDQSIAGVTFMDHFDFEYRYRNIHECDPLYWHLLHLPEDCVQLYEKLIMSRVAARHPFRIVKERDDAPVHYGHPSNEKSSSTSCSSEDSDTDSESCEDSSGSGSRSHHHKHRKNYRGSRGHKKSNKHHHSHDGGYWPPQDYGPTLFYKTNFRNPWLSPYEKMLNHIRTDVENQPRAPSIEVIPNLGPAAVYRQPISKISEMAIKKIAKAHKPLQSNEDSNEYEISLTKDGKDMLQKKKKMKGSPPEDPKYSRKIIQKDNMFVAIEQRKMS